MRDTFMFDLDGTVLPMDYNKFMELYFKNIGAHFIDKIHPKKLADSIMTSTYFTVKTKDGRTNYDKFMSHFDSLVDGHIDEYVKEFYRFYDMGFENVQAATYVSEEMVESIKLLKEKGYNVVLATNPLFPIHANHHRIRWAGVQPEDFLYISSFEENKYTKPHLEYYEEVLHSINKKPTECFMVGNDVREDLVSAKLGIETYLITDCMLNHHNEEIHADHTGTYKNFLEFVNNLEPVK